MAFTDPRDQPASAREIGQYTQISDDWIRGERQN